MQGIGDILGEKREIGTQKSKNIGERHIIFGEISEKLKATSYKKISAALLGKLLSVYKTEDLYVLHSNCKDAKNYAALFWYHVRPNTSKTIKPIKEKK